MKGKLIKTVDDVVEGLCDKRLAKKVADAKEEMEKNDQIKDWDKVSPRLVKEAKDHGRWRILT